jgi:hypothetical protein
MAGRVHELRKNLRQLAVIIECRDSQAAKVVFPRKGRDSWMLEAISMERPASPPLRGRE